MNERIFAPRPSELPLKAGKIPETHSHRIPGIELRGQDQGSNIANDHFPWMGLGRTEFRHRDGKSSSKFRGGTTAGHLLHVHCGTQFTIWELIR